MKTPKVTISLRFFILRKVPLFQPVDFSSWNTWTMSNFQKNVLSFFFLWLMWSCIFSSFRWVKRLKNCNFLLSVICWKSITEETPFLFMRSQIKLLTTEYFHISWRNYDALNFKKCFCGKSPSFLLILEGDVWSKKTVN